MPSIQGELKQLSAAVRGIITEASPLNFPEGASLDEQNFIINRDGSRQRRLGLGIETGGTTTATSVSDASSVHLWENAGPEGLNSYVLVQSGWFLYIFDANVEPLSAGYIKSLALTNVFDNIINSAVINGDFIFVYGATRHVGRISGDDLTLSYYEIKVRDLWGIDDALDISDQPSTLTDDHTYNLANQGWNSFKANQVYNGVTPNRYPSNADVASYGIDTSKADNFAGEYYGTVPFGNTPAPKGSVIMNPFSPGGDRQAFMLDTGFSLALINLSLYLDATSKGPTTVASYAGRVFYAGCGRASARVNSTYPDFNSYVFFSQTIRDNNAFGKCYQEVDPADPEGGILATDGGFIAIPEAGIIYDLKATGRSVLVLASNGVWEIYSTDSIFSPDNYQVRQVTNIGAVNSSSVVVAQDTVLYWSSIGIHALSISEVSQNYSAENIIAGTIQSLYDDISSASRITSKGFFDRFEKKLRWLYKDDGGDTYDNELIFDFTVGAWYKNRLNSSSTGQSITDYVPLPNVILEDSTYNIIAGADNVVAGTDNVIIPSLVVSNTDRTYKYLVKESGLVSFAEFNDTNFSDWGETDAAAFVLTGYATGGDIARHKYGTYITTHFRRTEQLVDFQTSPPTITGESSCLVQIRWDWSDDPVSGKFSPEREYYRHKRLWMPPGNDPIENYNDGYPVVTTKNRVRGGGKALNIKFRTSPNKDCHIIGWSVQLNLNSKV